jgi:tetratricopeptide (TPR) repeat protein
MRLPPLSLRGLARHPRRTFAVLAGLAVLCLAGYPVASSVYRSWQFARHLKAAREAEGRFDFAGAREHLAVCLRLRTDDPGAQLLAARAARRAGDYPAASEHLDSLREQGGEPTPEQTLERALLAAQRGDLKQAEGYLRSRLEGDAPEAPLILEALERGCLRTNRLNEALRWLARLLRLQPDNVIALVDRGTVHEGVGLAEKALEDYQAACAAQPEYRAARLRLGLLLLHLHRPAEALPHFEHLHARDEGDSESTLALAQCLAELDRRAEATDLLEGLLAREPDNPKALLARGRLALDADSPGPAERWLRRAVDLLPWDQQAHYHLSRCLSRLGKRDEAKYHARKAEQIGADMKRLVRLIRKAVQSPSDPGPRVEAGRICLRNGQEQQGLRWLRGALQIDPAHRPTHAALAEYYERAGPPDLAAHHRRLAGPPPSAGP